MILAESRVRQADVSDALADQLFEALTILLAGFEAAAGRDEQTAARLADALSDTDSDDDLLYGGLLTLLLRLVFLLYAEDRDLMPIDHPVYGEHLSVLALYDQLQADHARSPETVAQRFGAYPRLLATFRTVFYGLRHGDLHIPQRHGALFDPERYPFLEGWAHARAALHVPSISDDTVYRVLERLLNLGGQRLSYRALEVEQIGSVYAALMGYHVIEVPGAPGRFEIQPGEERRRTSSHYTPRSLSEPIVQRALEPLIAAMHESGEPSSEALLRLKVCDLAMGSGALLLAAVRFLAEQVVAAWAREQVLAQIVDSHEDPVMHARRLVAQRCIHGVDKNPFAVSLAKLSLWLETLARAEPFTFVDHALKCGDSLVGLDREQIEAFDWVRQEQAPKRAKQVMHEEAELALARARMIGDCIVGAFSTEVKDKARREQLEQRRREVEAWLQQGNDAVAPLHVRAWVARIREEVRPFHWWLEFPEVFCGERAGFDAVVSNPPFMGQPQMLSQLGGSLRDWLTMEHPECTGKTDLAVHFLRRANHLIGSHGTIGFITSKVVSQGDSRLGGLKFMMGQGATITHAIKSKRWPGSASVTIAVLVIAKGVPAKRVIPHCEGRPVEFINSYLQPQAEHGSLTRLSANRGKSFLGCKIGGQGFILEPNQAEKLLAILPNAEDIIKPYLGGEEINTSPTQKFNRYVIDFGMRSLSEASSHPELLEIVRQQVKPYRDNARRLSWTKNWWRFAEVYPSMRKAIANMTSCLVTAISSKHVILSLQPTDRIFSHALNVFAMDDYASFGVLQSRLHVTWAWEQAGKYPSKSTPNGIAGLRYAGSACFETFAFPRLEPEAWSKIESEAQQLYAARTRYMIDTDQGLTKTYNALKDPSVTEAPIVLLRDRHVELDRTVLAAYGWSDIEVPAFTDPVTPVEQAARQAFEHEIIERLFALNAERAAQEATALAQKLPAVRGNSRGTLKDGRI